MRKLLLVFAAAVIVLALGFLPSNRAEAITLGTPAGIRAAIEATDLFDQVYYVCRPVWRCGYYGCGWQRVCWWRPGGYYYQPYGYYYRPYGGYSPYYGYRRYW